MWAIWLPKENENLCFFAPMQHYTRHSRTAILMWPVRSSVALGLARAVLRLCGIADARAWPDMAAGQSKIVELTNPQKSVYRRTH